MLRTTGSEITAIAPKNIHPTAYVSRKKAGTPPVGGPSSGMRHHDRVAVRVLDAKLPAGRVERGRDRPRRDTSCQELVPEHRDIVAVAVEEDGLLRRDDRLVGDRDHELRPIRPEVGPGGLFAPVRDERVHDFEPQQAVERRRRLDVLDVRHRNDRAHGGCHPSTLPAAKARSSSGSEPKRSTWPSGSSTWISSAHG